MKIVGLTGSIGMGKTTVAGMFRDRGVPVFDADSVVHSLQACGGLALPAIEEAFPGVVSNDTLDRQALRNVVFEDPGKRKILEDIIHPLVAAERKAFLYDQEQKNVPFVILDVPLLFETGGETVCDLVLVVSASTEVQRKRVLARSNMTPKAFESIIAQQMSDQDKRHMADYIINTDQTLEKTMADVEDFIRALTPPPGRS